MTASSFGLVLLDHFIPGLSGALLLLMMGLIKQHRILISLGITALLGFISWYYYSLSITLLNKSIILMSFGFVFTLAFFVIHKRSSDKKNLATQSKLSPLTKWLSIGMLFLILALVNINIFQKEDIIKNGHIILLQLAPGRPSFINAR